jgi:hypothetical protein
MDTSKLPLKPKTLVMIGVAALALIILLVTVSGFFSTRSGVIQRENTIMAQYKQNQTVLSTYVNGLPEAIGVANLKMEKIRAVMSEAIQGRYETNPKPGTGGLFSAIAEAYPQLGNAEVYDRIVDYVTSKRQEFQDYQNKLQDVVREYNDYRKTGGPMHLLYVKLAGAPTGNLEVTVGGDTLTGEEALKKIAQPIIASGAKKAFETGVDEQVTIPQG